MASLIELVAGESSAGVAPGLGGSLLWWRVDGVDVLRPAPSEPTILDVASFPLIPFANRIGHGRFVFEGRDIELPPHPIAAPHALHGVGWESAWAVERAEATEALLSFEQEQGDWPWAFRAKQHIRLADRRLTIELVIENRDDRAMPVGFGIHPYFGRSAESAIVADAAVRWDNDPTGLATAPRPDPALGSNAARSVATLEGTDHFFATRAPVAVIGPAGRVGMAASDGAGIHVYVPAGGDFFCVEPVSHAPDSFGRGDFSSICRAGQTISWIAEMWLE